MHLDPALACRSLGGVATVAQLRDLGVGDGAIRAAVADGLLTRPRRGVVAAASFPAPIQHALRHGGRLTCLSLLQVKSVWTFRDDDRLHLLLGPGHHLVGPDGCEPLIHRSELRTAGGPAATTVPTALAELGRCSGTEHLVVALDSARHLGLIGEADLPLLRTGLPRHLRRVVDASTASCGSGLESLIRWRLLRLGIVAVPQVVLGDGGRRDLLVGDLLIIEADGGSHDDRRQRLKDMERDAYATARGYITLRFGYDQIVKRWAEVEAGILAVLAAGAHLR